MSEKVLNKFYFYATTLLTYSAVVIVLPSDHVIVDVPAFQKAVIQATENAEKGFLVTFGIVLSCPVNGCG